MIERLAQNLAAIRARIDDAAARAGRNADEITLVAVTKYAPEAALPALVELDVRNFGESRVQQLCDRVAQLKLPLTWHMIGHVQRNKAARLVEASQIVHSLDSIRLANALQKHAAALDLTISCYVEVNVSGEESKGGLAPANVPALLEVTADCPNLHICGLMTMAPNTEQVEETRPVFAKTRALASELHEKGLLPKAGLSMGMSNDFAVAIEEGATVIRLGSILFEGIGDQ